MTQDVAARTERLNPHLLDVVKRDRDYVLFYSGKPLTTVTCREVADPNPRLLEHLRRELTLSRGLAPGVVDAYTLFSLAADAAAQDPGAERFAALLAHDPVLTRRTRKPAERDAADAERVIDFLEKHDQTLLFMFGGMSGVLRRLNEFLIERSQGTLVPGRDSDERLAELLTDAYAEQAPQARAAVVLLCADHEAGVLLPLLLVLRRITPSEYANALFGIHCPALTPAPHAPDFDALLPDGFARQACKPEWDDPDRSFARLREQAFRVTEYLSCSDAARPAEAGVAELIAMGEGFSLEFKTTLRWNVKAARKDPSVEHASLKTVAAFLNSAGGTLLIGVEDDGSIAGLEADGFDSHDRYSLHFWNLVKSSMGQDVSTFIRTSFEESAGGTVFRAQCKPSPRPVFLSQKGSDEEFYIRVGPSSARLSIREALKYISHRFQEDEPGAEP